VMMNTYLPRYGYPVAASAPVSGAAMLWVLLIVVVLILGVMGIVYIATRPRRYVSVEREERPQYTREEHVERPRPAPRTPAPVAPAKVVDERSPEFWRSIKPGHTVILRDPETLKAAADAGLGAKPRDYPVKSVWTIRQADGLAEWRVINLEDPECPGLAIVVKIVEPEMDIRVMWTPAGFASGNRRELIARECQCLFEDPGDVQPGPLEDGFDYRGLQWAASFEQSMQDGDRDVNVKYQQPDKPYFGETTFDPAIPGIDKPVFTSVIEFIAQVKYRFPLFCIVEHGGEENPQGGNTACFTGYAIRPSDVDVLREQPVV
jgi:hypothetical protein